MWARATIRGLKFHIIFSDRVPEVLCADGPYRYIRHPVYASYIVAFVALPVMRPTLLAAGMTLVSAVFFVYGSIRDERAMKDCPLAADYAVVSGDFRRLSGGLGEG